MERLLRNEAHERGAIEFAGPIGVPTGKIANAREAGGGVVRSSMFHTRTDDGDRTVVRVDGVLDATKVDYIARMGGDWYNRADGNSMFEMARPPRVDKYPEVG